MSGYIGTVGDHSMLDQKQQFTSKWGSAVSVWDQQPFFTDLFQLLKADQRAEEIFLRNLHSLLTSSHRNLQDVFEFCLSKAEKKYTKKLVSFLADYFDQKKSYFLSFALEKHLIHQIWKPKILQHALAIGINPRKIIVFLSLKMRSLDLKVRKQALSSLYSLVETCLKPSSESQEIVKRFMQQDLAKLLPQMIEKEIYGKEVNLARGIILQILEDQFCEIKKKGIEFLGLSQEFFDIRSLRPLILYMLNDEHQVIRETSLAALSTLPGLKLQKQDLNALLVCLRQNNIELRSRTYSNIANLNATSAEDFLTILNKLFDALLVYKEDKRRIYTTCAKLGIKYPDFVLKNMNQIYRCIDSEEPNWKSLVYKARVILVACIGQEKWPKTLPKYFKNHYLYIRDVELYAFESIGSKADQNMISGSSVMFDNRQLIIPEIVINSGWQLSQYLNAYSNIYTGFLKDSFAIFAQMSMHNFLRTLPALKNKVQKLPIQYNLSKNQIASNLLYKIYSFLNQIFGKNNNELLNTIQQFANYCRSNESELLSIESNIFKTRTYDRSKVIITNNQLYLSQSFLQFSCSLGSHTETQASLKTNTESILDPQLWQDKDFKFIRMSQVEFEQRDERFCYFTIDFKWKRLRCMSIYGSPCQILVADALVAL